MKEKGNSLVEICQPNSVKVMVRIDRDILKCLGFDTFPKDTKDLVAAIYEAIYLAASKA